MKPLVVSFLFLFLFLFSTGCRKDEKTAPNSFTYELSGEYVRDLTDLSDGIKILNLKSDGSYCWTRIISGKDSSFCFGKYRQTSDTSMLWEETTLVTFVITPVDSIPKRIRLQINSGTATPPLYGFVK